MSTGKQRSGDRAHGWRPLIAGGIAGAMEAGIMYPTEFVKTQMQLAKSTTSSRAVNYRGPWDCVKHIVSSRGITGLYAGMSTLMVGSFFKAGVRFYTYDHIKDAVVRYSPPTSQFSKMQTTSAMARPNKATPLQTMVAGLVAGVCEAVIAVTPTETLKTKIIHDQNLANPRFTGFWNAASTVLKEEGVAGMYRGLFPTMLKQGFNQASRFLVYSAIMSSFDRSDVKDRNALQPTSLVPQASAKTTTAASALGSVNAAAHPWRTIFAGGVAGFVSVYITMPFDIVKTRLQSMNQQQSSWDCFRKIGRDEGLRAYWRGTLPRLGRVTCSASITFTCYEQLMALFLRYT